MNKKFLGSLVLGLSALFVLFSLTSGITSYLADKNEIYAETERSKCMRELEIAKINHPGINEIVWTNTCVDIEAYKLKDR